MAQLPTTREEGERGLILSGSQKNEELLEGGEGFSGWAPSLVFSSTRTRNSKSSLG
jgi:hypothetical protein